MAGNRKIGGGFGIWRKADYGTVTTGGMDRAVGMGDASGEEGGRKK